MQRKNIITTGVVFLLLCCSTVMKAQELNATLTGTVTDTSGAVIPGATVTIQQNEVNGGARSVQTDARGSYTATSLSAGTYTVTVTANGFETYAGSNVTLFV